VEKELAELRDRLAKVEEWKARKTEIEEELERVWVEGGDELSPPPYAETVDVGSDESGSVESESSPVTRDDEDLAEDDDVREESEERDGEETQGEGLFSSSDSWHPAHRP
jgi:ATP-binding cassette subfamily D (ALD) long-chain fatty acid import protein